MGIVNGSIQIAKKDSTWFTANASEVLKDGQLVFNETTSELFIGDGVTVLSSLTPINGGGNQDLQDVTDLGSTTNNSVYFANGMTAEIDNVDYISYIATRSNDVLLSYSNSLNSSSGQISISVPRVQITHNAEVSFTATSVKKNSVEVATVNDIIQVNTSTIGAAINGATSATPNDTDLVMSVDTSVAKKNTWTQIKAFLKTYFDSLYQTKFTDVENTQTITGTSITLPNTPTFIYGVFMNGQRLTLTTDYTISTNTITLTTAADSDSFTIIYKY
jgi:hypothetical protein